MKQILIIDDDLYIGNMLRKSSGKNTIRFSGLIPARKPSFCCPP